MMIIGNGSANRDLGAGGLARGGKRRGAYPTFIITHNRPPVNPQPWEVHCDRID